MHANLVAPVLQSQGTEEQKAKWLPLARNFSITGSYAQTELGHGENGMLHVKKHGLGTGPSHQYPCAITRNLYKGS